MSTEKVRLECIADLNSIIPCTLRMIAQATDQAEADRLREALDRIMNCIEILATTANPPQS